MTDSCNTSTKNAITVKAASTAAPGSRTCKPVPLIRRPTKLESITTRTVTGIADNAPKRNSFSANFSNAYVIPHLINHFAHSVKHRFTQSKKTNDFAYLRNIWHLRKNPNASRKCNIEAQPMKVGSSSVYVSHAWLSRPLAGDSSRQWASLGTGLTTPVTREPPGTSASAPGRCATPTCSTTSDIRTFQEKPYDPALRD